MTENAFSTNWPWLKGKKQKNHELTKKKVWLASGKQFHMPKCGLAFLETTTAASKNDMLLKVVHGDLKIIISLR